MHFNANKSNQEFVNKQILIKHIEQEVNGFLTNLIDIILEEERQIFIGRKKYERLKDKQLRIYINGYRIRNYLSLWSKMIRVRIPRYRSGNFKPLLFKHGRINSNVNTIMGVKLIFS